MRLCHSGRLKPPLLGLLGRLCHTLSSGERKKEVTVANTISFVQEQGIATLSFDNPARRAMRSGRPNWPRLTPR